MPCELKLAPNPTENVSVPYRGFIKRTSRIDSACLVDLQVKSNLDSPPPGQVVLISDVDIYEHIAKPSYRFDHESDQVYDLQTDDLLAAAMIENGKKHGNIFDSDYKEPWLPLCSAKGCGPDFGDKTWQATEDYMNEFMADPRR